MYHSGMQTFYFAYCFRARLSYRDKTMIIIIPSFINKKLVHRLHSSTLTDNNNASFLSQVTASVSPPPSIRHSFRFTVQSLFLSHNMFSYLIVCLCSFHVISYCNYNYTEVQYTVRRCNNALANSVCNHVQA